MVQMFVEPPSSPGSGEFAADAVDVPLGLTEAGPDGDGERDTDGDTETGVVGDADCVGAALRRTTTMRPHIPQFGYGESLPWISQ